MQIIGGGVGLLALVAALLVPEGAHAQRGVQVIPSQTARLINKDVGGERWAMRVDEADGTIVGNVYRADGGAPQFVWCWPQSTADDPVRLRCRGTTGCDPWVDLGEVELPGSFLAPASSCDATDDAAGRPSTSVALGGAATDPTSTLRLSPDDRRTLIAKDVGGLRWSVVYEPRNAPGRPGHHLGRITGNVFDPAGGPARFVSCDAINGGPAEDLFECRGADACGCGPCDGSGWTELPEVTLPRTFFEGRRCPAPEAPPPGFVATLPAPVSEDTLPVVALDGDVAAIAMPGEALLVFERDAGGWKQVARLASGGGSGEGSRFAGSVAVRGTTILASDRDRILVYERRDGAWTRAGSFSPSGASAVWILDDAPGALVLGVETADGGQVVRVLAGAGESWSEVGEIALPGESRLESFIAAALSGDTLALTVDGQSFAGGEGKASVYLYERRDDDWTEVAILDDPRFAESDFGIALDLDGDTLVIGDPPTGFRRAQRSHDGRAHVWQRGADGWTEVARLRVCASDLDRFGSGVALSGDALVVGATSFDGSAAGEVFVFERSAGAWREQGRVAYAAAAPQRRSLPLALSGSTLLVPRDVDVDVLDIYPPGLAPPQACATPVTPQWPDDDWQVEDPLAHGMNPVLLERARAYAFQPGKNTQGVVVVRHGVIVAEWYADDRDATSYAASWSSAKSLASAVVGIAIDRGVLPGVDVSLADYFPAWRGDDREEITLRDALTMTSGLSWSEDYSTSQTELSDLAIFASQTQDMLAYVLEKPLETPPGTSWRYSSADTMLLSGVLQGALGRPLGDYAREVLFDPIGMTRAEWWSDVAGSTASWCCVDAPTREFARFGLLFARDGRWRDRQVVSEQWVHESRTPLSTPEGDTQDYGYQWWLGLQGSYRYGGDAMEARGFDGQYISVFPSLDLVVVRNGRYVKDPGPPVADPNLFARYPSAGLGNGRGTLPPDEWDTGLFLGSIVDSIVD